MTMGIVDRVSGPVPPHRPQIADVGRQMVAAAAMVVAEAATTETRALRVPVPPVAVEGLGVTKSPMRSSAAAFQRRLNSVLGRIRCFRTSTQRPAVRTTRRSNGPSSAKILTAFQMRLCPQRPSSLGSWTEGSAPVSSKSPLANWGGRSRKEPKMP